MSGLSLLPLIFLSTYNDLLLYILLYDRAVFANFKGGYYYETQS